MAEEIENKCEENNGWIIAAIVIFIILLIISLWASIWVILVISNPDWIKTINIGQDDPEEDAPPNSKLAGMYSAIITIAIAIILGISFGCTKCWYNSAEKLS